MVPSEGLPPPSAPHGATRAASRRRTRAPLPAPFRPPPPPSGVRRRRPATAQSRGTVASSLLLPPSPPLLHPALFYLEHLRRFGRPAGQIQGPWDRIRPPLHRICGCSVLGRGWLGGSLPLRRWRPLAMPLARRRPRACGACRCQCSGGPAGQRGGPGPLGRSPPRWSWSDCAGAPTGCGFLPQPAGGGLAWAPPAATWGLLRCQPLLPVCRRVISG